MDLDSLKPTAFGWCVIVAVAGISACVCPYVGCFAGTVFLKRWLGIEW